MIVRAGLNGRQLERYAKAREVLRFLARGWSHAEIGEELGMTVSAVQNRVMRAVRLFRARNAAHAVVIAGLEGVLTPDDLRAAAAERVPR